MLCQSMTNWTPLRLSAHQRDDERRKGRRVLHEHEIGPWQPPQRRPQPEADARRVDERDRRVAQARRAVPQHRRREPVHGDVRVFRNCPRQRRTFEADQVNVDAVRRQSLGVVLHTGAASQISEGDDDGSHDGSGD